MPPSGHAILNSTPEALIGRVMSPGSWHPLARLVCRPRLSRPRLSRAPPGEPVRGAATEAERWLRGVGGERVPAGRGVIELTSWAVGYLGLNAASP